MKDVQIGGLRATKYVVGGIVERIEYLKKNQAFHNLLAWTVSGHSTQCVMQLRLK